MGNGSSRTLIYKGLATLPMLLAEAPTGNVGQLICPNKHALHSVHRHGFLAGLVAVELRPAAEPVEDALDFV